MKCRKSSSKNHRHRLTKPMFFHMDTVTVYFRGGEWGPVTFPAFRAFFGLCREKSSHANTRHFNEMRKQRRATTRLVAPRIAKRSDPRSDTGIASGGQIEELAGCRL